MGQLPGNTHFKAGDRTPMANVMLGLMHQLGMDDVGNLSATANSDISTGGVKMIRMMRMELTREGLLGPMALCSCSTGSTHTEAPVGMPPCVEMWRRCGVLLRQGEECECRAGCDDMTALHWNGRSGDPRWRR